MESSALYIQSHDNKMPMNDYEARYLDAAINGDIQIIESMLRAGIDVNTPDDRKMPKNRTALMHAAANGHLAVVELLLKAGAKLETKDKGVGLDCPGGNTVLILAIVNKQVDVANHLLVAGANPKVKGGGTTAIRAAVESGDFGLVQRLSELGADPEQSSTNGISAIESAVFENNYAMVELFLQNGAGANALTPGGGSLFESAVSSNNLEICKTLCKHGANPNFQDEEYRFSLLMTACQKENKEIVQFLLSVGAEVNAVNVRNESALNLIEACQNRYLKATPSDLARLTQKGKDIKTILETREEIRAMLLKAGAKRGRELKREKAKINTKPNSNSEHLESLSLSGIHVWRSARMVIIRSTSSN